MQSPVGVGLAGSGALDLGEDLGEMPRAVGQGSEDGWYPFSVEDAGQLVKSLPIFGAALVADQGLLIVACIVRVFVHGVPPELVGPQVPRSATWPLCWRQWPPASSATVCMCFIMGRDDAWWEVLLVDS